MKLSRFVALSLMICGAVSCSADRKFKSNSTISVISREDGSGTRGAFIELFGIEKKGADGKKIDFTTDEAVITNSTAVMIAGVAGSQYAVGYVSLGSLNESVKAVKIDGELPGVENINNGSYKISRSFNVAVKENISPAAQDFLDFILSDGGQKIVAGNKYIQVQSKAYKSSMAEGKVVVSGSSSVSPLMEKLIEAYGSVNPNAKIELQTSDSSTGVSNAIAGTCDIGMASRSLKDSEKAKGVKEITIAIDGIAVIVNKANPLENLTKENVEAIFTGKITKWNEIN
ncbi:MAG: substrate-binding domain-containing protein [Treponema sp.]|nr:substrate-binding domain-containing protein [Treponema sp.]